jgi:hypothetical protein
MIKKLVALTAVLLFVGNASAFIPEISNTDITPKYADAGEQVTYELSASGDDNLEKVGVIVRDPNGNVVIEKSGVPANNQIDADFFGTINSAKTSGEYEVEFFAVDGGLRNAEYRTLFYKINEPSPDYTLLNPQDGETFSYPASNTGANIDFSTDIDPQSSGTLELFIDFQDGNGFNSYYSEQVSSGLKNVETTELISEGSGFEYLWRYTRDSTGTQFNSNVRTFSVDEVDQPPSIDSIDFSPSSIQQGESIDVSFDASDGVGLQSFDATVSEPNGNQLDSQLGSLSGTDANVNLGSYSPATSGTYDVTVTVEDTNNQQSTRTESFTVGSENAPSFNLQSPSDNQEILLGSSESSTQVNYDVDVSSDFSGTLRLFRDGVQVKQQPLIGGTNSYSFSENLGSGSYTYRIKATSDNTGTTYESIQRSFTVTKDTVPKPSFDIGSPVDGGQVYIPVGDSSTTVDISGTITQDYSGTAKLFVDGQNTGQTLSVPSGGTSYFFSESLGSRSHTYTVQMSSGSTDDKYNSTTVTFDVIENTEQIPTIGLSAPQGVRDIEFLNKEFPWEVNINSSFNGTATLDVEYPGTPVSGGAFTERIFTKEVSNLSELKVSGFYSLNNSQAEAGEYTTILAFTSDQSGNVYTERKSFSINTLPKVESVAPTGTVQIADDQTTVEQRFTAEVGNAPKGFLQYRISKPNVNDFAVIKEKRIDELQETASLDFTKTLQDLDVREKYGNETPSTEDFQVKAVYIPDNGVTVRSDTQSFRFSQQKPGPLDNGEQVITNLLGPNGLAILAVLISIFSAAYVGILVENGSVAITTMALSLLLFVYLGWFPILQGVTGVVGTVVLLGGLLIVSDRIGGVIS